MLYSALFDNDNDDNVDVVNKCVWFARQTSRNTWQIQVHEKRDFPWSSWQTWT